MNRVSPRTKPKNLKIKENKTKTVTIYKEKRKKKTFIIDLKQINYYLFENKRNALDFVIYYQ